MPVATASVPVSAQTQVICQKSPRPPVSAVPSSGQQCQDLTDAKTVDVDAKTEETASECSEIPSPPRPPSESLNAIVTLADIRFGFGDDVCVDDDSADCPAGTANNTRFWDEDTLDEEDDEATCPMVANGQTEPAEQKVEPDCDNDAVESEPDVSCSEKPGIDSAETGAHVNSSATTETENLEPPVTISEGEKVEEKVADETKPKEESRTPKAPTSWASLFKKPGSNNATNNQLNNMSVDTSEQKTTGTNDAAGMFLVVRITASRKVAEIARW